MTMTSIELKDLEFTSKGELIKNKTEFKIEEYGDINYLSLTEYYFPDINNNEFSFVNMFRVNTNTSNTSTSNKNKYINVNPLIKYEYDKNKFYLNYDLNFNIPNILVYKYPLDKINFFESRCLIIDNKISLKKDEIQKFQISILKYLRKMNFIK